MPNIVKYLPGNTIRVKSGSNVRLDPSNNKPPCRTTSVVETWFIIGTVTGKALPPSNSTVWYVKWHDGHYDYMHQNGVSSGPTSPLSQADVDKAVAAATKPLLDKITAVKALVG